MEDIKEAIRLLSIELRHLRATNNPHSLRLTNIIADLKAIVVSEHSSPPPTNNIYRR